MGYNTVLLGSDNLGNFVLASMVDCSLRDSQRCAEGETYDVDPCSVPDHPMCQASSSSDATYSVATRGANAGVAARTAAWQAAASVAAAVLLLLLA